MNSWLVWAVVALAVVLLGFVGYHFTVRALRFSAAALAAAVVVVITRYGVMHSAGAPADLVNAFTRGSDDLSAAFLHPLLLGHHVPVPGRAGWLVLAAGLAFGYRELEVWAMRWQPPTLDMSALGSGQPGTPRSGTPGAPGERRPDGQLHDRLVAELRFRLPAVDVRSPAILPGGASTTGLASIVENSGVEGSGLAGAILRFVGALWPSPRRYQVRVWLEPASDEDTRTTGRRVTVDLEDPRTGASVATKTLPVRDFAEASSVVAGYVARHIFVEDPTAPPWCVGAFDGTDLAAVLVAGQEKVYPASPADVRSSRRRKIGILENCNSLAVGSARYELAHLYDLEGDHIKALLLHALNREHFPRFCRGRYRLGMSLEMIANPYFKLADKPNQEQLRQNQRLLKESLRILDRCGVTHGAQDMYDPAGGRDATGVPSLVANDLSPGLRGKLLAAAKKELDQCRRQLSLPYVVWGTFRHRDERGMRKPYWRLRDRQRFHDGALVAGLLVTVRQVLNNQECTREDFRRAKKAARIITAVTGCRVASETLLTLSEPRDRPELERASSPGQGPGRTRWLPWQRRTQSWPAAYNTACLYAALADSGRCSQKEMARRVVISLTRAINDPYCELERPSDWISQDPDFAFLKCSPGDFKTFLDAQRQKDYPAAHPEAGSWLTQALCESAG